MGGIFGIADPKHKVNIESLSERMGKSLSHKEWYVVDTYIDRTVQVAFGRVGIGIFNKATQPFWDSSHTIALLMAGEIYAASGSWENNEKVQSHEKLILELYLKYGASFVEHLNGAFVCVIWDQNRKQLIIANDRYGLYPTYYTFYKGRLLFAPEVKAILQEEGFPKKLDMVALSQYMRFQHLLGQRTFFDGISLLPNASTLVFDILNERLEIKPYWTFADFPEQPKINFQEAVEQTGWLLRNAVRRLSGDSYRPGVYLSGGLDSRTILGLIKTRPVASLTYGVPDSRDVQYAHKIAAQAGSDHHYFNLSNPSWILEHVDLHLELTEGFHSWIHMHGMNTLEAARQFIEVNLTGWDGGTVMGHIECIEPLQHSAVDNIAFTNRLFHLYNQEYTWPSLTESEEMTLYAPPLEKRMRGVAFDSFREELDPYLYLRPDIRGELFYVNNHCHRLTQHMVTFTRSHIEVRFPFFDNDLLDFLYSIPAHIRGHRKLYREVIRRETPHLAVIPFDKEGFLPTTQFTIEKVHKFSVKLKRRFNRHIYPFFSDLKTLYVDYENHLRRELYPWASELLFDRRTIERRIFSEQGMRSLLSRHKSGLEEATIGKIAPLMTYEMMLRRLYDDPAEIGTASNLSLAKRPGHQIYYDRLGDKDWEW
jgi:asparagine synthase (glutamine-hydrolysing)